MLNRLNDVFASFQRHEVKDVIIGGVAAVIYGVPRATFDLDILIAATPENAHHLLDAFLDAGLGTASLDDLIASKRAAGRDVDLADVRLLQLPTTKDDR